MKKLFISNILLFFFTILLPISILCSCSSSPYQGQGRTLTAVGATIPSLHDETEDQLIEELFGPNSPGQQNINPYTTMPVIPHTVKEMQYASGMKPKV